MLHIADTLTIEAQKAVGQRFAALGKSGSGKTNSLIVFAEAWLSVGWPFTFVDPMASAVKLNLHDSMPVILASRRKNAHLEITTRNAAQLASFSLQERVSVILDMSLYDDDEQLAILQLYLETLWRALFVQDDPAPYALIVDEAQIYAPQSGNTPISKIIIDMAKRGRHKNLTTMVATQRAASIVKDFLTQATLLIAHRLSMGVDTKVLREQLPLPEKDLNAMMRKLKTGQALVIGEAAFIGDEDYVIAQVRPCRALQPESERSFAPSAARQIDEAMLEALKALAAPEPDRAEPDEDALREQLRELEQMVQQQRLEIASLQRRNSDLVQENERLRTAANTQTVTALVPSPVVHQASMFGDETNFYRSQRSLKTAKTRQRKKFDQLLGDLRLLPPFHLAILGYLIDSEGEAYTVDQIAYKLGLSATTIKVKPPLQLITMGLLERVGERGKYQYRSTARSMLRERFPDLDTADLVEQLFRLTEQK